MFGLLVGFRRRVRIFVVICLRLIFCLDPDPSNLYNDCCTMIKIMEYMALGKPIVAFDLPEHRVSAQEAAVYARDNNELEFAQKIAELIDNPQKRAEMGQIGRQRIDTELSWAHQEKHLLQAYKKVSQSFQKKEPVLQQ